MHTKSLEKCERHLRYSKKIAAGVYQVPLSIVNAYLVGPAGAASGDWVLVDAGLHFSGGRILKAVAELYGAKSRPRAIVLTHGHFDHVGALKELADFWDVPVYAHEMELPYLDGRSAYPPPDPAVGGGAMSLLSPLYPGGPINVSRRLSILPGNGAVPPMPGWSWIHTPGHAPGHVSLYRERDGALLAGDAFVTTRQESFYGAVFQPLELSGPPKYFTPNWEQAARSVKRLSRLRLSVAGTGHGKAVYGKHLRYGLRELADNFWHDAVPSQGRYVDEPARVDEDGVEYVPPRILNPEHVMVAGVAVAAVGLVSMFAARRR